MYTARYIIWGFAKIRDNSSGGSHNGGDRIWGLYRAPPAWDIAVYTHGSWVKGEIG